MKVGKKNWSLNLNQYRNTHFQILSKAKREFAKIVEADVMALPQYRGRVSLHYTLWLGSKRRTDISNVLSVVDKFFSDTLVEHQRIPDDDSSVIVSVTYSLGGIDPLDPRAEVKIEEHEMKIYLEGPEIRKAVFAYIREQIPLGEGKHFHIEEDFDDLEVSIVDGDVEVAPASPSPQRRKRRTKEEILRDEEASKPQPAPEVPPPASGETAYDGPPDGVGEGPLEEEIPSEATTPAPEKGVEEEDPNPAPNPRSIFSMLKSKTEGGMT